MPDKRNYRLMTPPHEDGRLSTHGTEELYGARARPSPSRPSTSVTVTPPPEGSSPPSTPSTPPTPSSPSSWLPSTPESCSASSSTAERIDSSGIEHGAPATICAKIEAILDGTGTCCSLNMAEFKKIYETQKQKERDDSLLLIGDYVAKIVEILRAVSKALEGSPINNDEGDKVLLLPGLDELYGDLHGEGEKKFASTLKHCVEDLRARGANWAELDDHLAMLAIARYWERCHLVHSGLGRLSGATDAGTLDAIINRDIVRAEDLGDNGQYRRLMCLYRPALECLPGLQRRISKSNPQGHQEQRWVKPGNHGHGQQKRRSRNRRRQKQNTRKAHSQE